MAKLTIGLDGKPVWKWIGHKTDCTLGEADEYGWTMLAVLEGADRKCEGVFAISKQGKLRNDDAYGRTSNLQLAVGGTSVAFTDALLQRYISDLSVKATQEGWTIHAVKVTANSVSRDAVVADPENGVLPLCAVKYMDSDVTMEMLCKAVLARAAQKPEKTPKAPKATAVISEADKEAIKAQARAEVLAEMGITPPAPTEEKVEMGSTLARLDGESDKAYGKRVKAFQHEQKKLTESTAS